VAITIRPKTVATMLGVSRKTVYRLLAAGEIRSYRIRRCLCIAVEDVERYQRERENRPAVPTEPPAVQEEPTPRRGRKGRTRGEKERHRHVPRREK